MPLAFVEQESLKTAVKCYPEQSKIVPRLQDHCRGNFLQRHSKSTTPTGCPLLSLPPYHEIIGLLKLTEWEMKIIEDRAEAAKAA